MNLHAPAPLNSTLHNQILCGYQGWFAHPNDGSPLNRWNHWFSSPKNPSIENLKVDLYPYNDEYNDEDLYESNIPLQDGSNAKFYSAAKVNVVKKHFEWMRDYGIAGVFHIRFMNHVQKGNDRNRQFKTKVLQNVRIAAEATDRVFAVSYNMAGRDDGVIEELKQDWMRLVDEENITKSARYLYHDGLPVLRIYGIGFKSVNVGDTDSLSNLLKWFKNAPEEKYRVFLVGGVPSRWRQRVKDSREELVWKSIYDSLDAINPWHVGRWNTLKSFEQYYSDVISSDVEYCNEIDTVYMPTMWPGFSWHNLKKATASNGKSNSNAVPLINSIPRLGGKFLWSQAFRFVGNPSINTIWMAQFDEVDEGTAIFKVAMDASEVPAEGQWLTLDADGESLPRDWYLRLCGEAQKMLNGEIALTNQIPIAPFELDEIEDIAMIA